MNLQEIISSVLIYFILDCFHNGHAKLAPDYIHPCNQTSRECLIKATQDAIPEFVKGIPELGVASLDPIHIDVKKIFLSDLTFTFRDVNIRGFKKCIIDNVESYLERRKFLLSFHCNLTLKSTYDASGQFLLFPINGRGDAKVKLINWKIDLDINTKYTKDKANVDYFSIKNYKYTFDYGDQVIFDFKNLFNGNPQLSDEVLKVLNLNWRLVVGDFGKPFIDYCVEYVVNVVKAFFRAVPYDELINVPIPL